MNMRRVIWNAQDALYLLWQRYKELTGGIPYALRKATEDPFDYALGLRTGQTIHFHEARIRGRWVFIDYCRQDTFDDRGFAKDDLTGFPRSVTCNRPFSRGVYIRLSDIVWVADAPNGS